MSFRRAARPRGSRRWWPLLLALAPVAARAELPAGWTVHTFTGRIHEIEPAGGTLACATDGGLLFFDPQTQQFATIADAGCGDGDCLSSNRLTSVSRDADGAYWLGTEAAGVVVFRPASSGRKFGRFFELNASPGGGLLADSVTCIEAYRARTVYVGTSRGVAQIELVAGSASYNQDASRRLGSDLKGTLVHDLAVDSLFVWVATDSGVSRFTRTPPYAVEFLRDGLAGPPASTVEILAGTVYAGTAIGVFQWQPASGSWVRVRGASQTPPDFPARAIARRPNGGLFVGSDSEVQVFTGFIWGPLSPPALFLLSNRRFTTMVATGDTLWTCQQNDAGEGAYLERWTADPSPGGTWTRFQPDAIPPSAVLRATRAPNGDLWIGTQLAGVARLSVDGTWCIWNGNDAAVRAEMSDDEGHVSALLASSAGRTWFTALPGPGESRPVDLLAPAPACDHAADTWTHIQPGQLGFGGRYWRIEQDDEGNVFLLADGDADAVTGEDGGMDVVSSDLGAVRNIRSDALGGTSIGALAFATTSRPWETAYVGVDNQTNEGLKQWSRSNQLLPPEQPPTSLNFRTLPLPSDHDIVQYRDIVVTPSDPRRIWVGTESRIFEYDVTTQSIVTELAARVDAKVGLLSGDVKDLQFDDFGNLWVATVKGLNRLRLAERGAAAGVSVDAFTTIETIRELNAASSVGQLYDPVKSLAPLPSPLVNALSYDHDRDLLYIGTAAGLAVLDVQALSRRQVIPVSQVVLYPNPVRIDAGHEEVRIAHLSEPATVTIYNIEGEVVCEVSEREDGDVVWTLSTPSCLQGEGNFQIASGLYPVRIATSSGSTMRTLVVIR